MKNEEKYVTRTLESMAFQTLPPVEWVIVNDGSTDRSAEIVNEFAAKDGWIRMLDVAGLGDRLPEHYGGHVVDLFYEGLRFLTTTDFDFVVKLDCDVSFQPDFFETLLNAFERNEKLGISSGIAFAEINGVFQEEKSAPSHTLGATKVYRKKCFGEIGGLVPSMGWDGIDEVKARMKGWEAWPLRELVVHHHRPEGAALGLMASGVERGKGSYFMGYHPLFMIARVLRRMLRPGLFTDGIGMLVGYFASLARHDDRIPDPEFIRFLQKHQLRKLLFLQSEV
jgi:glycosyltransferase involved in cell wall biosynthesis